MESKKKISNPELKGKQNKTNISRRSFLKRSAYSAPVLMAMGQLMKPANVHAYEPDGCPDWDLDCR